MEVKTNFKPPRVTEKVRRRRKREARTKRLRDNKQQVRDRERKITRRGCRFPLCGCYQWFGTAQVTNRSIEVSHLRHQGMGGNPKEDRNVPELLVAVCGHRHKDGRIAIDKGTLECRPLTDAGTDGPVSWWARVDALPWMTSTHVDGWFELARETSPGKWDYFSGEQSMLLDVLEQMEF